jgi:serine/threonine protein kinase/tetratricopeptide (TPR) repeat protein
VVYLGRGRWELRRKLGEGGMGMVWEAHDREQGTSVALKTLLHAGPDAIARFKREFRALADVVHPNLVALYELFAEADELFFTMELVPGVPFGSYVRPASEVLPAGPTTEPDAPRRVSGNSDLPDVSEATELTRPARKRIARPLGPLDEERLRVAMRQLAEGVCAIHAAGMLHRDLKPSNVLVTGDGRVVVLDFGLATDLASELTAGDDRPLEGTVPFMSPEQAARLPLGPASDWYSVGVMLYHALTGRTPFTGARDDVLMDKQLLEPTPPSEHMPGVPSDLEALCLALLRRRPEDRPGADEVLRRLGSSAAPPRSRLLHSSVASYERFVGRDAQLQALGAALDTSRSGAAVLVHLSGPSGMGKSRVLRAFLDQAKDEHAPLVLQGRCYERESVPFKALDSLVDALARHLAGLSARELEGLVPRDAGALARLFPVLRQVEAFTAAPRRGTAAPSPHEVRRRAFGALRDLVARLADRRGVVLAVDDVQWADLDSAALLAHLLRPPDAPAALVVLAYRSEDVAQSEFLRELDEQVRGWSLDVRRVPLGPLTGDEARKLAELLLRDPSVDVDSLVRESGGIPLFLEELVRQVRDGHRAGDRLSLTDVLRERLARLPPPAARLLAMVAVAGRPVPQDVALRAAEVDDPAMLSLLKAGSFVRGRAVGGERLLEAYHDRVRESVVAGLDERALREHHRRLAVVLESLPHSDAETLAAHWRGAGEPVRAAEFAARGAARAAEALAFDRAARLFRLALELDPEGQPHAMRVALGDALGNAGRGAEAAEAYLAAAAGADPSLALDLKARAGGHFLWSGHIDRGLDTLADVLGDVGLRMPRSPAAAMLSIAWNRARLRLRGLTYKETSEREIPASQLARLDVTFAVAEGLGGVDTVRAADFHWRHLLLALRAGEPRRLARALAAEAIFTSLDGVRGAPRAARVLRTVHELAQRLDDPALRAIAVGADGIVAFNEGRWDHALEMLTRAEQIVRDQCTGLRWEIATAQLFGGFVLALTGRVREMIRRFPALVEEASERGDLYAVTTLKAGLGFYLPLAADDPAAAYAQVDDAMARWSARGFHLQHSHALVARASTDLYVGEPERAMARFAEAWPALERSLLLKVQLMRGILTLWRAKAAVAAAGRSGDRRLLTLVRRTAQRLDREGVTYLRAAGRMLEGTVAVLEGRRDEGLRILDDAEKLCTASGMLLNSASVRRARGLLVGGSEGAALVAAADTWFAKEGIRRPERIVEVFLPGLSAHSAR